MSVMSSRLIESFLIKLCISLVTNSVTELHHTRVSGHPVRLTGGSTDFRGRVEVLYNNSWGTICDDNISIFACRVICKQLGYRGGICISISPDVGSRCRTKTVEDFGDGEGPIWLDSLTCSGYESTIDECQHNNWGEANCSHKEDAGCICESPAEKSGACDQSRHRILSFDDANPGTGLVQVQDESGAWGLVCDDMWDDIDATVFCSCLGFNRTKEFRAIINTKYPVPTDLPIIFDAVHCTLTDTERANNLFDCSVEPSTNKCRPATEAAAVSCQSQSLRDNTTKPEPKIDCDGNVMTVCIKSVVDEENTDGSEEELTTAFPSGNLDNPHLAVTPVCQQVNRTIINNSFCYIIDMKECDSIQLEPGDHFHRHDCYDINHIGLEKLSPSQLLVDSSTFRVCCTVPKQATVMASFLPQSTIPPSFHQMTSINYSISCFNNSSFAGEPLTLPAQVIRGSMVYCQLRVNIWQELLYLTVPSCRFLSSASSSANSFEFVKDRCLMSRQLGVDFFSFGTHGWGFSFRMPKFESSDEIYLSCDSYLCDLKSDSKERCDRSCSGEIRSSVTVKRERRQNRAEANGARKFRMMDGPFRVKDFGCGPLIVRQEIVEVFSDSKECNELYGYDRDEFTGKISSALVAIADLHSVLVCLILVLNILESWI